MPGAGWQQAYEARAEAHWTPGRLSALTGGKALRLRPDNAPCLLRAMGVLDGHAALLPGRERKYRQINHLLSFLEPALQQLSERGGLQIVDAGCGRSALGFLVMWWLHRHGAEAQLLGLDRNAAVIAGCEERATLSGLSGLAFREADLGSLDLAATWAEVFDRPLALDAVLALHACDTATDDALAFAVSHDAGFFAVAPCCQAELARKWSGLAPGPLAPLHDNPHLRRTTAATVTDAMRAELMRSAGYDVWAVEFVEAHHTPKNTLVYGHRSGSGGSRDRYDALKAATGGCGIGLADRLPT